MPDFSIRIERLNECVHAFEEAGSKVPPEFSDELMKVGERVAEGARGEALAKGLYYKGTSDHGDPARRPGDLIHKITVRKAGAFRVAVVEHSRTRTKKYPTGYLYPRRYEYEKGGARAFMRPAAELMTPVAEQMVDEMVDQIFESEGF